MRSVQLQERKPWIVQYNQKALISFACFRSWGLHNALISSTCQELGGFLPMNNKKYVLCVYIPRLWIGTEGKCVITNWGRGIRKTIVIWAPWQHRRRTKPFVSRVMAWQRRLVPFRLRLCEFSWSRCSTNCSWSPGKAPVKKSDPKAPAPRTEENGWLSTFICRAAWLDWLVQLLQGASIFQLQLQASR